MPFFHHTLQKYPLPLDLSGHRGVTLLGIFHRCFADNTNVIFPRFHIILQSILFGLVMTDKIVKVTRASENLKPVT